MTPSPAIATGNLGFLSIVKEPAGYVGGYLVTNAWGRPLEFRLSSSVQPTRVQHILYGPSLEPYVCGDLIGKALFDKAATAVQVILTDHPAALELRCRLDTPLALVNGPSESERVRWHPQFPSDAAAGRKLLDALNSLDLAEPFGRIREALAEARKLGVAGRN